MSTRLIDVLIDLSQDPFKCEEFRNNPHRVLEGFDTAEEETALLIDGDTEAIGMYLAAKKKKKTPPAKKKKTKKPAKKKNGGSGNLSALPRA